MYTLSDLVGSVGQLLRVFLDASGVVGRWGAVDAGVVGGQRWWGLRSLLDQLEDGQTDGYDEREEGQLQGVPRLQTEYSDGERDERERLEHDENHDGHEDLLQLMTFACTR